jgi:uncharacterized protein YciI
MFGRQEQSCSAIPKRIKGEGMKYLVLTMRGPAFDPQFIPEHYDFLDDLRTRAVLEQSGPFTDKTGGAYVLRAQNLDEARRLAEQDPLCRRHCSEITVREWDAR